MLIEVLNGAYAFQQACRNRASCAWFRGHAQSDWALNSSLHRYVDSCKRQVARGVVSIKERRYLLRQQYKAEYRLFERETWRLLTTDERDRWGMVFAMQHHGFPTRLLDWTESFAIALFFAHRERTRKTRKPIAVWALDPQALNQFALNRHGLVTLDSDDEPSEVPVGPWHPRNLQTDDMVLPSIAVAPRFTNARISAQRGAFTMMGDDFRRLDKQFKGQLVKGEYLIKLALGPETFDEVEAFLSLVGLTQFAMFPDLDNLSKQRKIERNAEISLAKLQRPDLFKKRKRKRRQKM
jgi:hypothetical protein